MVANFADNVVYHWSSGDSLVGKQAVKIIIRPHEIDGHTISLGHIVLPVQVNESQAGEKTGKWILYWTQDKVK
jgi:hypothetical protein